MNKLEETIVDVLLETTYYDFEGDKSVITADDCREAIKKYGDEFSWISADIQALLRHVDSIPSELVAIACEVAWNQINWDDIANFVHKEIE